MNRFWRAPSNARKRLPACWKSFVFVILRRTGSPDMYSLFLGYLLERSEKSKKEKVNENLRRKEDDGKRRRVERETYGAALEIPLSLEGK